LAWAAASETMSVPAKARMTSGRRSRVKLTVGWSDGA
jgi:hypothetical protein